MHRFRKLFRGATSMLAALVLFTADSEATAQVTVRIGEAMTVQAHSVAIALEGTIEATGTFDTRASTITFTQTDGTGGVALTGGLAVTLGSVEGFEGTTIHGPVQLEGTLRLGASATAHIAQGATFTVLSCTGGCTGTFDAIEAPFAVEVRYGTNAVTVTALEVYGTSTEDESTPERFALRAPYPNPFSGTTYLQFEIETGADVRVEAFDLLGRRVGLVAAGTFAAGNHRLAWMPDGLGAGTYLLRVQVGHEAARVWPVTLAR